MKITSKYFIFVVPPCSQPTGVHFTYFLLCTCVWINVWWCVPWRCSSVEPLNLTQLWGNLKVSKAKLFTWWHDEEILLKIHRYNFQLNTTDICWVEINRQFTLISAVPDICWFHVLDKQKQNFLLLKCVITPVNKFPCFATRGCLIFYEQMFVFEIEICFAKLAFQLI